VISYDSRWIIRDNFLFSLVIIGRSNIFVNSVLYIMYVETIRPSEISRIPGEELNVSYFSVGNDIGRPL